MFETRQAIRKAAVENAIAKGVEKAVKKAVREAVEKERERIVASWEQLQGLSRKEAKQRIFQAEQS